MFISGDTESTQIGYINRNNQKVLGTRGVPGNDHLQKAYKVVCQQLECGHVYGANGSDLFQRKCPKCQDGKAGIEF